MEQLSQDELKKMLLLSYDKIEENKEQINKINVFPVPDQDTGSNLAKTLLGMKESIEGKDFKDLKEISEAALDGALTTAQGNAGVIYVGFLASFLPSLDKNPVNAQKLAIAFEKGAQRARQSIQNPKEGTILDVIDSVALVFKKEAEKEKNIIKLLKEATERAREALLATREKMEVLRKANVVDAGGLGFLMILESYLDALQSVSARAEPDDKERPSEKIKRFVQVLSYRYEVIALIENSKLSEEEIKEKLKKLGNSIDVVRIGDKTKIHIHTDYPDEVKNIAREAGQIADLRTEDMAKEVAGEESVRKVSIGIITDDISALLPKILERYQIELVFTVLDWPELEKFPGENIYQKIREAWRAETKTLPKTSQAAPKAYFNAYKKQLQKFDKVLCLTVSSKLSGCYNSALQAKEMLTEGEKERVYVLDSLSGAAGQGLLILRAIELIREQREINEILEEIKKIIPKTHVYVIFQDPKGIESIGRITKGQANWVRRMKKIGIHPVMQVKEGAVGKGGIVFAKDISEALFKKTIKDTKREKGKRIRVIINHADNLEGAEKLKKLLKKEIGAEVSFISEGPPIICAVTGPGTLIVGWQVM